MEIDVWHALGPVAGTCGMCGVEERMVLGEFRSRPTAVERLKGRRSVASSRQVMCGSCGWRWTVRLTDTAPMAAIVVASRNRAAEAERLVGAHRNRRKSDGPTPAELVPFATTEPAAVETTRVPWPRTCPRRASANA